MQHNAISQWPRWPNDISVFTRFLSEADEAQYTITARTSGTGDVISTVAGGVLRISGAATTEDSGASVQRNEANWNVAAGQELRFLAKFTTNEATQSDIFAGFYATNTNPVAGIANGVFFRKPDGSTRLSVVHAKGSTETVLDTGIDIAANTDYVLGLSVVNLGSDGTNTTGLVVAVVNDRVFTLPVADLLANTVILRDSFHAESGSASGTFTCDWYGEGAGVGKWN